MQKSMTGFGKAEVKVGTKTETYIEKYTYTRVGLNNGTWSLSNQCAKILSQSGNNIEIEIITGRSGTVNLIHTFGREVMTYPITILSI